MAELRIKAGVQPPVLIVLAAIANEAQRLSSPSRVWITSGIDGRHMARSRHYQLCAVDVRSKNFPSHAAKLDFRDRLQARLGADYRVILEAVGRPNEHFHVELD